MPTHPQQLAEALHLLDQGAYPQAIGLLQQAVAAHPAHFNSRLQLAKAYLGWALIQANMPLVDIDPVALSAEAAHYLQLAQSQLNWLLGARPGSPHVQGLLAMVHLIYDRPAEALGCLKKALAKDPGNPELLYNLADSLMLLERYPEAVKELARLTALHPRHGLAWHMLGQARKAAGEPEAELPAYRRAMALLPGVPEVFGAMANALKLLGRHVEAMDTLRAGLVHQPNHQDLNFALSKLALLTADWDIGWRFYACRYAAGKRLPIPENHVFEWQPDRPVRVRFDQGLGDELLFLRFLPTLVARGMSIHYSCHPKLYPLLLGQPHIAALNAAMFDQTEEFDCLVGDLPWVAGMRSTADIPSPLQLTVDSARVEALREELASFGPPPYLGVTWQGGKVKQPGKKDDWRTLHKEVAPAALGELAHAWPGTVVMMQRVPKPADVALFSAALGRPWLDWSALNDSLPEALAGLSLLDEYVGVSNTNMHLLAGIGKTARVLVPHPAEWLWMAEGDESPWFPGFKIYRQSRDQSWNGALANLAQDLADKYHKKGKQE